MIKKSISIVTAVTLLLGLSLSSASSAGAATISTSSNGTTLIAAKPNFMEPVGGGSSTPSNPGGTAVGKQVCYAIKVVTGFTTVWLIVGNVSKPVLVAIYGSEWICTIVYG
jgi:hypothetical protein